MGARTDTEVLVWKRKIGHRENVITTGLQKVGKHNPVACFLLAHT